MAPYQPSANGEQRANEQSVVLERLAECLSQFDVSSSDFIDHLGQVRDHADIGTHDITNLALEDMVLAYACSRGKRAALAAFDDRHLATFNAVAGKLRLTEAQRADSRQRLWQRLFVASDGPPKILDYRGKSHLALWFRVMASRFLLNEVRSIKRDRLVLQPDYGELSVATDRDPELSFLEQTYRQQFRGAFRKALMDLQPEQRNALRCHFLHAMSIDRMAEVFGVHRATAARRVVQAREDLLRSTCTNLRDGLGLDTEEIKSIIARVKDQSTMSIARLLELGNSGIW